MAEEIVEHAERNSEEMLQNLKSSKALVSALTKILQEEASWKDAFLKKVQGHFTNKNTNFYKKFLKGQIEKMAELLSVGDELKQSTPAQSRDKLIQEINQEVKKFMGQKEVVVFLQSSHFNLPEPRKVPDEETRIPKKKTFQNPEGSPQLQLPSEITHAPDLKTHYSIDSKGQQVLIKGRTKDFQKTQTEKELGDNNGLYPIFTFSKKNPAKFLSILSKPESGMENKDFRLFLFIEKAEAEAYEHQRVARNLIDSVIFVSIPDSTPIRTTFILMLYFALSMRKIYPEVSLFNYFYFMDENIARVRAFEDQRINFVACSLYLALKFIEKVMKSQMTALRSNFTSINLSEDAKIETLLSSTIQKNKKEKVSLLTLGGTLQSKKEELLLAVKKGTLPSWMPFQGDKEFTNKLLARIHDIYKELMKKVYGVGLIDESLNNFAMYNERKLQRKKATNTSSIRYNYKLGSQSDKRCILLNAYALEDIPIESIRNKKQGKKEDKGNEDRKEGLREVLRDFYALLTASGSSGFQVFNFDFTNQRPLHNEEK